MHLYQYGLNHRSLEVFVITGITITNKVLYSDITTRIANFFFKGTGWEAWDGSFNNSLGYYNQELMEYIKGRCVSLEIE